MANDDTTQVEDGASPNEEGTTVATKKGRPKALTEADVNRMFEARSQEFVSKAQAPLQRRISDLERENRREKERADASWNYRDDPDAYKKWEEEFQRSQVREEFDAERTADKRRIAMLEMKVQYPNVPNSAYDEATTPQDVEIAALKWERTNGAAPLDTDETPPDSPGVLSGVGGAGSSKSDSQWWKEFGTGSIPATKENMERAEAIQARLMRGEQI